MKIEDHSSEVGLPQRFNFMTPGNSQPQDKPCHTGHRSPFARAVFTSCGWLCAISLPTLEPTWVGRGPWDCETLWFSLCCSQKVGPWEQGEASEPFPGVLIESTPQGLVGTPPQLPGKQAASPSPSTPGSLGVYHLDQVGIRQKKKKKKYPAGS